LAIPSESDDDYLRLEGWGSENYVDTYVYMMQYSTLKTAKKQHGFHGFIALKGRIAQRPIIVTIPNWEPM
jgi:hypothetical protein